MNEQWKRLMQWAKQLDERDISDQARWFSTDAPGIMSLPTNQGEWAASLEVAFDAGREPVTWLGRDRPH